MVKRALVIGAVLCACSCAFALDDVQAESKAVLNKAAVVQQSDAAKSLTDVVTAVSEKELWAQPTDGVRAPADFECSGNVLYGQPGDGGTASYSEKDHDPFSPDNPYQVVYDDFLCSDGGFTGGTLDSITFWGITVDPNGGACNPATYNFEITLYKDAMGRPDFTQVLGTYTPTLTPAFSVDPADPNATWSYWLHRFEYTLPAPITLDFNRGWITIQGDNAACEFAWLQCDTVGNLRAVFYSESNEDPANPAVIENDFAFCLHGTSASYTGVCCDERSGMCFDGIGMDVCCFYWARFEAGGTCGTLDPSCTEIPGACCLGDPNEGCVQMTRAACESTPNGRWDGPYSSCDFCCYLEPECTGTAEGEPPVRDYAGPDTFNGGCTASLASPSFSALNVDETICGKSGKFWGDPNNTGAVNTLRRDIDEYLLTVPGPGNGGFQFNSVTIDMRAEFPFFMDIFGPVTGTCEANFLAEVEIDPNSPGCLSVGQTTVCVPPGDYIIRTSLADYTWQNYEVSPDSRYTLTVSAVSECTPSSGACCVEGACVATTDELDCESTLGGFWFAGKECGVDDFACPCDPNQTIWNNGAWDLSNSVYVNGRWDLASGTDETYYTVDDVVIDGATTMTGFWTWQVDLEGGPGGAGFNWAGTVDVNVYEDDGANKPGTLVTQILDVPAQRWPEFGVTFTGGDEGTGHVYYGLLDAGIELEAGTYWVGIHPVISGAYDGSIPYNTSTVQNGEWAWIEVYDQPGVWQRFTSNTESSFCLLNVPLAPQGCPGDTNCDGEITYFDINYFLQAINGEQAWIDYHVAENGSPPSCTYLGNCDVDQDGSVDYFDINPFLDAIGTSCP